MWINETGYATLPGRTEEDQARWWIRAAATFLAQPRIDHLGIYEIKDLRSDREAIGDAPNYHLGITYTDRRRKLAFTTLQRLVSMLGTQPIATIDARDIISSPSAADVYRYLFQGADGRQFLFLWTRRDAAVATISSRTPGTEMIEYSIGGAPSGRLDFSTGKAEVTLRAGDVRMFERLPARSR